MRRTTRGPWGNADRVAVVTEYVQHLVPGSAFTLGRARRRRRRAAARSCAARCWRAGGRRARRRGDLGLASSLPATARRAGSDAALAAHVAACVATFAESARIHGALTVPSMFPAGDLIAHAVEWTGLAPQKILDALAQSSPVSAGREPAREALLGALRVNPDASRELELARDPREVLESLARRTDDAGVAARAYFDTVGYRSLSGYDVTEPYGLEVPFVLVEGLRALLAGRTGAAPSSASATAVRDRVPDAHRNAFDALIEEARAASSIRDERVLFNDYWSAGVARRALLEVGRRLTERGLIPSREHATACVVEEVAALLDRSDRQIAAAVVQRFDERQEAMGRNMPAHLGPSPSPPPPVAWMPASLRRVQAATAAVMAAIFQDGTAPSDPKLVRGIGVSPGAYAGSARVVRGPHDFHRLRPGDVLVTRTTSPTFNVVLPLLGAIVTDRGGALSHAAIVSREFGIPGVVGCREATSLIPDGARVRVDGGSGVCELLA